eukprot:403347383
MLCLLALHLIQVQSEIINLPVDEFRMKFPLSNETFSNWNAHFGSSVFMKNRLVLTSQGFDKSGLVFNKQMILDFEIGNHKQSPLANGVMQIYFLANHPEKTSHEFSRALNHQYKGFMIEIKENSVRGPQKGKNSPQRLHEIYGLNNKEEGVATNNMRQSMCRFAFTEAQMKIIHKDGIVEVQVKNKLLDSDFEECFKVQADLTQEKYFFVSANSGKAINNYHFINKIEVTDLDQTIERSQYEEQQRKKSRQEKVFIQTSEDIIHKKGDHFNSTNKTKQMYNIQLLRYNNIFTRLMTSFILNQDKQLELMSALPKDVTLIQIQSNLLEANGRLGQIENLFSQNMQHINRKVQLLERAQQDQKLTEKLDRLQTESKKIEEALMNVKTPIVSFMESMQGDRLSDMIEKRRQTIEERSQTGEIDEENMHNIEHSLMEHMKQKIEQSHRIIQGQLKEDDLLDYILVFMLVGVAVVGYFMWNKVKEQQKTFLL